MDTSKACQQILVYRRTHLWTAIHVCKSPAFMSVDDYNNQADDMTTDKDTVANGGRSSRWLNMRRVKNLR